jgi:hypothetical protein
MPQKMSKRRARRNVKRAHKTGKGPKKGSQKYKLRR